VVPARLAVRSVLGDCHLEMQDAVIRQRLTVIDATAKLGSITIFVPDGVEVRTISIQWLWRPTV
jgi:predicted membrane protein